MATDFINEQLQEQCEKNGLRSYDRIYLIGRDSKVRRWVIGIGIGALVILFLPWTQNIRARGTVTSLRQEQRTQELPTIIPGKVVKWYVKEGDIVKKGDTIITLAEIKDDYLDPQLLQRTREQLAAKTGAVESYKGKVSTTAQQIEALRQAGQLKLADIDNKIGQQRQKITADSMDMLAAANDYAIKQQQFKRQKVMFDSGLVSMVQLEQRNQAFQESQAKKASAEIKFTNSRQELIRLQIERNGVSQDYLEKVSKAEGDRYATLSQIQTGEGEIAKLQNQYMNYNIRSGLYTLTAPQDGQVVRARKAGLGEVLKEGEIIVEIVPSSLDQAVEMFISPIDLPLISPGQKVRLLFDGYPYIVFSGWPQASHGTFAGEVAAIESSLSGNGKFRVLVRQDSAEKPWPPQLMMGTGSMAIALLKDVPVWYELWRNINGFPPEFYKAGTSTEKEKKKK
jgi:multidrug efflux pump subunit AcrA (membrane-fusion protein)